jgi:hypothetical protein
VDDPTLMVTAAAAVTTHLTFGITHGMTCGAVWCGQWETLSRHHLADATYVLARRFSTDHLTKGKIAFNVVTLHLDTAARNFGLKHQIEHDERYHRAEEYMKYALYPAFPLVRLRQAEPTSSDHSASTTSYRRARGGTTRSCSKWPPIRTPIRAGFS